MKPIPTFELQPGDGPLVAAAIHNGHSMRAEVARLTALTNAERLREEDPYTGVWTSIAPTRVIGLRSRFEFDLNRPRHKAVYQCPDDAWGLCVWHDPVPAGVIEQSIAQYDLFYEAMRATLDRLIALHQRVVVFDLHTYNHRRNGQHAPVDDPENNPEVNVGTGSMDRLRWASVVERFIGDLRQFDYCGRQLDVRENIRFQGGNFPQWIHAHYPTQVCAIAIEVKKFFMDEWTGEADWRQVLALREALASTVPGVLEVIT
jgi:N-formylglutamate amidohydrolase